ncbi:hypothetical protein BAUCODRAFT_76366 [Baudoinia panamericana UAMH 10762]|uniref:Uncharacterized protein n=1 Tax=Baudoinia panamericana (strain UAMH 10762) TaxID=717646 RepID=M2LH53_BAUPA|nr:uncharacterized protein BAUCODRAFT_76366 [Baudoinia panamericana UAMH 10762]EMC93457.1 hypothetical protein BAUCODRAFT_76366 [Baudoinia panamericana UAMH 10762]
MRHAYDIDRNSRHSGDSISERSHGNSSTRSRSTQPTDYSTSPANRTPQIHQHWSKARQENTPQRFFADRPPQESPRASVESYTSTVQSEGEVDDRLPEYDPPVYEARLGEHTVLAATPADFAELFPSRRRLTVHHDDSTLDGNMNLRIDTEVCCGGRKTDMTLFHLRMHDLRNREFSLRRYCRDSGREVCHSEWKQHKHAVPVRPGFQRSLSNILNNMRPKSDSRTPTLESLKRHDSGYGSMHSVSFVDDERPRSAGHGAAGQHPPSDDTIRLEFSNYAHVDVKRTGLKGSKRYEFEYWGVPYAWRRIVEKDSSSKKSSYHLTRHGSEQILAYIVPVPLSSTKNDEERSKGGWVPPSKMWLADESLIHGLTDAVDVVVASGLIVIVDDAIKARFHSRTNKQLLIPKMQVGVEYVGPKRLITEMFRRDSDSSQQSRPTTSHRRTNSGYSTTSPRVPAGAFRQPGRER